MVRLISKMILTLYQMLYETLSFVFIVISYLIVVSSIFTTLYQDINPSKFNGLAMSARTLFDAIMAVYDYAGMGDKEL